MSDKVRKQKLFNGKTFDVVSDMNEVKLKMSRPTETYAELTVDGWELGEDGYYTQTVTIDIISDTNDIIVSLAPYKDNDFSKERIKRNVRCNSRKGNKITFTATEKPMLPLIYKFLVDVTEAELHDDLIKRMVTLETGLKEILDDYNQGIKDMLEKYGDMVVMMDIGEYIEPADRKTGSLYFNATEKVSSGSSESCESIKVSPNMGIKIKN